MNGNNTIVAPASAHTRDRLFIGGAWAPSAPVTPVHSPATEEIVGYIPAASMAEVDQAVAAARSGFDAWAATTPAERARLLRRLADEIEGRRDDFAAVIQAELAAPRSTIERVHVGLPVTVLRATADILDNFAFETQVGNSTVLREPIGVVAAITPWNYPLHQITSKVGPAFAAGCTVVLKPADLTPLTAFLFAEAVEAAGFPAGVFNLVTGPGETVGEALALHKEVDMVSFTGSVAVGRTVARDAMNTIKRVSLELGGKSASIIAEDVDGDLLATAVKVSVGNAFLNSGQTCSAWTRLLVPEQKYEQVKALIAEAAAKYQYGSRIGPMISAAHRKRVMAYMAAAESEGFETIAGGSSATGLPDKGWYVAPTAYGRVTPGSRLEQEEVFGPVLSVITYRNEDEAVAIANDTIYGLAGGVWAGDRKRGMAIARRMKTGQVDLNGGAYNPIAPFGGYKQSGTGRELGAPGIEEFLEYKAVQQ